MTEDEKLKILDGVYMEIGEIEGDKTVSSKQLIEVFSYLVSDLNTRIIAMHEDLENSNA